MPQSSTIDAENEWDALPVPDQNFDKFYNMFSANSSKSKSMTGRTTEDYSKKKYFGLTHQEQEVAVEEDLSVVATLEFTMNVVMMNTDVAEAE